MGGMQVVSGANSEWYPGISADKAAKLEPKKEPVEWMNWYVEKCRFHVGRCDNMSFHTVTRYRAI